LRGRQGLERGNLHELLGDQDKNVEIQGDDRADDVREAPRTRQTENA